MSQSLKKSSATIKNDVDDVAGNTWTVQITKDGAFNRQPTDFHHSLPSEEFPVQAGRYHLYIAHACPWAHRCMFARALFGLEDVISVSYVHYLLTDEGWHFDEQATDPPAKDDLFGSRLLREVYSKSVEGTYKGRVTVPVLFDKETNRVVNNESSEILHILNGPLKKLGTRNTDLDLYPEGLREEIDEVNSWIYEGFNNAVYRAGFARSQAAYDEAVSKVFASLDRMEELLKSRRWIAGDAFTLADIRLFTTLIRFDPVYHVHFKCSLRRIKDYPHVFNYMLEVAQLPHIAETINMDQIVKHYYTSHESVNPFRIVPLYPQYNFEAPHNRDALPDNTLSFER